MKVGLQKKDTWAFNKPQVERYFRDRTPFDSYEDLQYFSVHFNLDLLSFEDIHKRKPHHPYELLEFQEDMASGYLPRIKKSPIEEVNDLHNDFLNTEEGKEMFSKDPAFKKPSEVEIKRSADKAQAEALDTIGKAVSGSHYNDVVPGYQYMQMMQHMLSDKDGVESHLLGQVYKYLMRAGKKDDVEQEYRKARWYLNCLVKYKQTGEVDPTNND